MMYKSKLLHFLFLLLFVSIPAQNLDSIRVDGIYQTKCVKFENSEYYSNLRFFPNGSVIYVSVNCDTTIEQLQKWFNEDYKKFGIGNFKINGKKINGEVENIIFNGKIKQDKIILRTYAYNVNTREKRTFKFKKLIK